MALKIDMPGVTGLERTISIAATDTDGSTGTPVDSTIAVVLTATDQLIADAGEDVFVTGYGDDALLLADDVFTSIDMNSGLDTLTLGGDGMSIDLSNINGADAIDMSDAASTANNLSLTLADVLTNTDSSSLSVLGDAADTVNLASGDNWTSSGSEVVGGVTFDSYDSSGASLLIEQGINVQIV